MIQPKIGLKERIAEAFRARGIRCTAQRIAIASRATIHNTLTALVEAGLVREVSVDGNAVRFDANMDRHHHFICRSCGALEDMEHFELPEAARRDVLGARTVSDYEIVFRGVCESCAKPAHRMK